MFQGLERTFQPLERMFHRLECTFHQMKQTIHHREKTFIALFYNILSTIFQEYHKCTENRDYRLPENTPLSHLFTKGCTQRQPNNNKAVFHKY